MFFPRKALFFVIYGFLPRNCLAVESEPPGDSSICAWFWCIFPWTAWRRWIPARRRDTVRVSFGGFDGVYAKIIVNFW